MKIHWAIKTLLMIVCIVPLGLYMTFVGSAFILGFINEEKVNKLFFFVR